MNNINLELFDNIRVSDKKIKLICTCEEGKEYQLINNNLYTTLPINNHKGFKAILELTAISIFILILEPLYENL